MADQLPTTKGPIDSVPCPWCGHRNDFRTLNEQQLLDTGHRCLCDGCGRSVEVVAVRPVVFVALRQDHKPVTARRAADGRALPQQRRQAQAQQQLPQRGGFFQRLLGGPKR